MKKTITIIIIITAFISLTFGGQLLTQEYRSIQARETTALEQKSLSGEPSSPVMESAAETYVIPAAELAFAAKSTTPPPSPSPSSDSVPSESPELSGASSASVTPSPTKTAPVPVSGSTSTPVAEKNKLMDKSTFIKNFNEKSRDAGFTLSNEEGSEYTLPKNLLLKFGDDDITLSTIKGEKTDIRYAMTIIGLMLYATNPEAGAQERLDTLNRMNIITGYESGEPFSSVDLLGNYKYIASMNKDKEFTFVVTMR